MSLLNQVKDFNKEYMNIIHEKSLDFRCISLRTKKRNAIRKIKQGEGYNAYVIKMDGTILKYEISDKTKQGYTQKTLKPSDFKIVLESK